MPGLPGTGFEPLQTTPYAQVRVVTGSQRALGQSHHAGRGLDATAQPALAGLSFVLIKGWQGV